MTQRTKEIKNYIYQLRTKLTEAQTGKQNQSKVPSGEYGNENKANKYVERKEKKKIGMQIQIEVNEEDLYTLKINCKGKRTVGKANK